MVRWIRSRRQLTAAGRAALRAVVIDRLLTDPALRIAVTIGFRDRVTMSRTRVPDVVTPGVDMQQLVRMVLVTLVNVLDDGHMVTTHPGPYASGQRHELVALHRRLMNGVLAAAVTQRYTLHMDTTRAASGENPELFVALVLEDLADQLTEEWSA